MFKSALDVIKAGSARKGAGGFRADPVRENGLFFATVATSRHPFVFFRIGKELARKAGLALGDTVIFEWAEDTCKGVIKPHPEGWKLVSGNVKSDTPPLILRVTWREGFPSTSTPSLCSEVIASSRAIKFKYPKDTSFGELAKKMEEKEEKEPVDELYEEHKKLVESINKKAVKQAEPKGESEAPTMKDGKPYGRRKGDKKVKRS